jgi:hypothetical protein
MTVLDLGNNVAVSTQIPAQALTASASDATAVDMNGATWAVVHISAGTKAGTTSVYTFKVEDSADNSTDWTTVKKFVDGEVSTTDAEIVVTATPGATDARTYLVAMDARRLRRYVRIACDITGGSDSFPCSASIVTMPDFTGDADAPDMSV